MTIVVLLIIALAWTAYLVPPWLRNRREDRPHGGIQSFNHQLTVLSALDRTSGRKSRPAMPGAVQLNRIEARQRRRDIFFFLLAAAGLSLALAVVLRGVAVYAHLAVDALLLTYVYLLVRMQRLAAERSAKVRYLAGRRRTGQPVHPALAWQRSASN